MLTLGQVNRGERIRDIALLCDECYATRASGPVESVKFERGHDEDADCSETPIDSYIPHNHDS
jgi:hypothetical protein